MTSSEQQSDVTYSCDPKWHGNNQFPADFFIQGIVNDQPAHMAFAVCEEHTTKALRIMLKYHRTVKVREVNK